MAKSNYTISLSYLHGWLAGNWTKTVDYGQEVGGAAGGGSPWAVGERVAAGRGLPTHLGSRLWYELPLPAS
jgi:hypothetical protein